MTESLTINFSEPFPLFPLPQCVLLPHATIPLHIFEPRYYKMVSDVLDGHGMIAMSAFEGDDWKQDYEGSPPLRPFVCLGHIVRHEALPNNRYHILLQGLCRARLIEEVPSTPYRMARLDPTETVSEPDGDLDDHRRRIESLLTDKHLKELAGVSAISHWLTAEVPTTALVDLASMALCDDNESRYRLLAEPNAVARAQWLEHYLKLTRRSLEVAQRFAPPDMPDGINLN
ncbi:MAG: LON peptidase substrate-binding domain-containing protein [Planctomycetes bacterium]|nr:LON peptidase substrate-binding domain-containing protein [Planctomycetota bacterium]